jgi:hypothetical protein
MNILLLTDVPPCNNYTAGIVLNILCDFLLDAGHTVCCFAVKAPAVDAIIPEDKQRRIKFFIVPKPRENWGHAFPHSVFSFVGNNLTAIFKLPGIAKKASKFAKQNRVALIWSVVQGQTMIKLTRPVSRYANVPYIIQIWDPPKWWLKENKFDKFTENAVLKEFGRAIHNSTCCIAASWAMAEEYKRLYACPKSETVILGFETSRVIPKGEKDNSCFVIALSGQMYASDELFALIAALNILDWKYANKKIILRFYGRSFHLFFSNQANIEIRGWLPQEKLLSELADTDLLYCPYWFNRGFEEAARLSFPSKLSTYLKTGIPVLFHGPEYASPRIFLEKYNAAYICGTLDIEIIADTLKKIIISDKKVEIGENGYRTFCENISVERMRTNFFNSINFLHNSNG